MRRGLAALALLVLSACAHEDVAVNDDVAVDEEVLDGADGSSPMKIADPSHRVLEEGGVFAPPEAPEQNALICSATLRTVHANGNCRSAGSLYSAAKNICRSTGWPIVSGGYSSYCGTVYGVDYYRYLRFQCCVWN